MYVVTGAGGRLGSHLVSGLLAKGKKVRVLVRKESDEIPPGAIRHVGDITAPETLEGLVGNGDTVFHLAGVIKESLPDSLFHSVNVLGTENMLAACNGKEVKRFVFVSSISVFGDPVRLPADEGEPKAPKTKYGRSKLLAEEIVQRKWKDIPATIARPGMIYGPGFDEGYIPVLKMLEKGRMPVIGSGNNRIPLIHVHDLLDALMLLSEKENAIGEDFIITGPGYPTQRELFSIAAAELGVKPPGRSVPVWLARALLFFLPLFSSAKISPENLGQLTRDRAFDSSKIRKALGFEPRVGISQGIKEMVSYYRSGR